MRAIRAGPTSGSAGARSSDAGGSNAKSGLGNRGHSCKEETWLKCTWGSPASSTTLVRAGRSRGPALAYGVGTKGD